MLETAGFCAGRKMLGLRAFPLASSCSSGLNGKSSVFSDVGNRTGPRNAAARDLQRDDEGLHQSVHGDLGVDRDAALT